jgi:uncharacterized protein with NAD-binding domain and iron-sulfur cluster
VLSAPANDAWIDPWVAYLTGLGVTFRGDAPVTEIHHDGQSVQRVDVGAERIEADSYILCVPVDVAQHLSAESAFPEHFWPAGFEDLSGDRMNGAQYYLRTDVPLAPGHVVFVNSDYALTSISQRQFWPGFKLPRYGGVQVEGVLSVDISDWTKPSGETRQPANKLSREQVLDEVRRQIEKHLNSDGTPIKLDVLTRTLDPAIVEQPDGSGAVTTDLEPLFINRKGEWKKRPTSVTPFPNLFLASDYVQTETDLATMEAANEAARHAVNGVLRRVGASVAVNLWPFPEPGIFAPFRRLDAYRYRRHVDSGPPLPEGWGEVLEETVS